MAGAAEGRLVTMVIDGGAVGGAVQEVVEFRYGAQKSGLAFAYGV